MPTPRHNPLKTRNPRKNKAFRVRGTAPRFGAATLLAAAFAAVPTTGHAGDVELVVDLGNGGALSFRSDTGASLDINGYSIFSSGGLLADIGDETLGDLLSPLLFDVDNAGSDEVSMTAFSSGGSPTTVSLPVSPADLALNIAWIGGLGGDPLTDLLVEYGPADPNEPVVVQLDPADIIVLTGGGIFGDYNNSGQVEQADLDFVLQNWGDTDVSDVTAWVNFAGLPGDSIGGLVEQTELDLVLSNWGDTSAPDFAGSAVPEPGVFGVLSAFLALGTRFGRTSQKNREFA